MQTVRASARYGRAIDAISDLLARLRIEFIFVGNVARAAWLDSAVPDGSIDVIALMRDEQKNQVATMASNRGFRVERSEIEQTEELDVIPLYFVDPEGDVRIHVLLATNALYGRMVSARTEKAFGERTLRVPVAEDLALLLAFAEDRASIDDRAALVALPEFDRRAYNQRVISIGLPQLAVAE